MMNYYVLVVQTLMVAMKMTFVIRKELEMKDRCVPDFALLNAQKIN